MQEPKLEGKIAVVTGAGSSGPGVGTGKAISVLFGREGAKVVLVDKFEDRAKETLALVEAEGAEAAIVTTDLADIDAGQRVIDEAIATFGGVDILVNNAAIPSTTGILDTPPEVYSETIAVNLTAPYMLTRAVLPVMVERGGGSILNIISIAALRGQGGRGATAYAASKAGLMGLMVDVADGTLADAVARAVRGSLAAYKNGYSDPYAQDEVVDRVNAERGEEVELTCYYNDRRQLDRDAPAGDPPTAEQIRAALDRATVDWPDDPEKSRTGLYASVSDDGPDAVEFLVSVDLRHWTRGELVELVRDIEAAAVAIALDPTAPTGVRSAATAAGAPS